MFSVPTCRILHRSFLLQSLRCSETAGRSKQNGFRLCNSYLVAVRELAPRRCRSVRQAPAPSPAVLSSLPFPRVALKQEKAIDWTVTDPTLLFQPLCPGSCSVQPNPSRFFLMQILFPLRLRKKKKTPNQKTTHTFHLLRSQRNSLHSFP